MTSNDSAHIPSTSNPTPTSEQEGSVESEPAVIPDIVEVESDTSAQNDQLSRTSSINILQSIRSVVPDVESVVKTFLNAIATKKSGQALRKELVQHLDIDTFVSESI